MGQGGSKSSRSGSGMHQEQSVPITVQPSSATPVDSAGAATVQVPFYWKEEGSNVFLVGSFSNWNNKIAMARVADGFAATVPLVPGPYEYKFIVDGQWRCAQQQPKVKDHVGNENNWIHVELVAAAASSAADAAKDKEEMPITVETLRAGHLLSLPDSPRESYTSHQPTQDLFLKEPPLVPPHLHQCLLTQGPFFHDSLLASTPSHVVLNHLYHSELPQYQLQSFAMSRRLGSKYVTSVVYLPLPPNDSGTLQAS